jgi:hypothetical protein
LYFFIISSQSSEYFSSICLKNNSLASSSDNLDNSESLPSNSCSFVFRLSISIFKFSSETIKSSLFLSIKSNFSSNFSSLSKILSSIFSDFSIIFLASCLASLLISSAFCLALFISSSQLSLFFLNVLFSYRKKNTLAIAAQKMAEKIKVNIHICIVLYIKN